MNCKKIVNLLVDYFDGNLDAETASSLETHLANCEPCVDFVETYRQTGCICREALAVEMPGAVKSTLFEFLRTELEPPAT